MLIKSAIVEHSTKNKWKLLLYAKNILDKCNIPFWIESGTLLGFIRENQFLSHSNKIHIGIHAEHLDKIIKLRKKFRPWHKLHIAYDRSGREWIDGNITGLYTKPVFKSKHNSFRLYITPRFFKDSRVRWIDGFNGWVCKSASSENFTKLDSLNIRGIAFSIPHNAEQYLHNRYGDWYITIKEWDTNHDDKAIISKKELNALPRKTRWTRPTKHSRKIMLTGRNLQRAKRLLANTGDLLNKHGIRWWLDNGTLLGIMRNNELIPWDQDVDICVPGNYAEKFLSMKNKFLPRYKVHTRLDHSGRLPGKLRVAKIKFLSEKFTYFSSIKELHLDIYFNYHKDDGYCYWIDSFTQKKISSHYYYTLDTIDWDNHQYPIPSNIDAYLTDRFGDWRTPVQKYDSSLDDLAIID